MHARNAAAAQARRSLPPASQEQLRAEARAWARALKTGRPTAAQAEAFKAWRGLSPAHARAWAEAASDWRDIGAIAEACRAQQATAPARRAARTESRLGRRFFLGSAFGASGAVAFAAIVHPPMGLWPSWAELGADHRTATGEQQTLELASGVQAMLNTQTSIAVQSRPGDGFIRIELLAGELAVQNQGGGLVEVVAQGARAWLGRGGMEVKIAAGGQVRVLCDGGALELRHPSRTVKLQARQQVVYGGAGVGAPAGVDLVRASAWRDGIVVFDNTPLAEAVEEINRYRRGRVVLLGSKLADRQISGRFRIAALDEALVQIRQLFGTGIRTVGGVVLLG